MSWISAYLYYAEPWDKLLVEAVKPFAEEILEAGLAEKYFFIRYWERGPHIRLRFQGDEQVLNSQVKPKLENWFSGWMKSNPSDHALPPEYAHIPTEQEWCPNNSVQWVAYEPETERYGGEFALAVGESQFQASSEVILTVMDQAGDWTYDQSLGCAIQMHLAFARAMNMDRGEAEKFFSWIFNAWLPMALPSSVPADQRAEGFEKVLQAFDNQYEEQKEVLAPFIDEFWTALTDNEVFEEEWLNQWCESQKKTHAQLVELHSQGKVVFPDGRSPMYDSYELPWEKLQYWSIYSSYVHMTNNRLGVQNRDEGYLGYLLRRGLSVGQVSKA